MDQRLKILCTNIVQKAKKIRSDNCQCLRANIQSDEYREHFRAETGYYDVILNAILKAMELDADNAAAACKKIRQPLTSQSSTSSDLLMDFIRILLIDQGHVPIKKLFNFMNKPTINICYYNVFSLIIQNYVLNDDKIRKTLSSNDWNNLYVYIKSYYNLTQTLEVNELISLKLFIKWAPSYCFSIEQVAEDFDEIEQRIKSVKNPSTTQLQLFVEIINECCNQIAAENRKVCCIFGENIFDKLLDFYQLGKNNVEIKMKCIEVFNIQLVLHHPKGVSLDHPCSFSHNPTKWVTQLEKLKTVLLDEIKNLQLKCKMQKKMFEISENFIILVVKVLKQTYCEQNHDNYYETGPSVKKIRKQTAITALIENIKRLKEWIWIHITTTFLKTFPQLILPHEYSELLEILLKLLEESTINSQKEVIHYILESLVELQQVGVENRNVSNENLWKSVNGILLDSVKELDENSLKYYYTLVQLLLPYNTQANFIDNLCSENTMMCEYKIQTIKESFLQIEKAQADLDLKFVVIKWLLRREHWVYFHLDETAELLVNLVLKEFVIGINKTQMINTTKTCFDLEKLCFLLSLEDLIEIESSTNLVIKESIMKAYSTNLKSLPISLLCLLTEKFGETDLQENLNRLVLIFNFLCLMLDYKILNELSLETTSESELLISFKKMFIETFDEIIKVPPSKLPKHPHLLQRIETFFSNSKNKFMIKHIHEVLTQDHIKFMFYVLSADWAELGHELNYKTQAANILIDYCLCFFETTRSENQSLAWVAFNDYASLLDNANEIDFLLKINIAKNIAEKLPSQCPKDFCLALLHLLQCICSNCYDSNNNSCLTLEIFPKILTIVFNFDYDDIKTELIEMLSKFSSNINLYSMKTVQAFIRCISTFYELDSDAKYLNGFSEKLILKLSDFLEHKSIQIRFYALLELAKFFKLSTKSLLLKQYHLQEILFSKIQLVTDKIMVSLNLDKSGIDDKISIILHTYAIIILNTEIWRMQAIDRVLKINKVKFQTLIKDLLNKLAENFHSQNKIEFLNKYLQVLFSQWTYNEIERFPFWIFNCNSKIEFYSQYWELIAPLIINIDLRSLKEIVEYRKLTNIVELLNINSIQLVSFCMAEKNLDNNTNYKLLIKALGHEKLVELFHNNIEEILLQLIGFVNNDEEFRRKFDLFVIFPKTNRSTLGLNAEDFYQSVKIIEKKMFDNYSVILYLLTTSPMKIYTIFINILIQLDNVTTEIDKMQIFYQFTVFLDFCLEYFDSDAKITQFLFYHIINTLLQLIDESQSTKLEIVVLKYLKIFVEKILPKFQINFAKYFQQIVFKLKLGTNRKNEQIQRISIDILSVLFIAHGNLFETQINRLDSLPEEFSDLFSTNKKIDLRSTMHHFIENAQHHDSTDDLVSLREHLQNKDELKILFDEAQTCYFGDEKRCDLSRFVCTLIKLAKNNNRNVLKCLAEIGSCSFSNRVLNLNTQIPDIDRSAQELFCSFCLVELTKLLTDKKIHVVSLSGKVLNVLLTFTEVKKIIKSEENFGLGVVNEAQVFPLISEKSLKFIVKLNENLFIDKINKTDLWVPEHENYSEWIKKIVSELLACFEENDFFACLISIMNCKTIFCAKLLPILIFLIVSQNNKKLTNIISEKIGDFLENHWNNRNKITQNVDSILPILNTIEFVRLQNANRLKKFNYNLEINYLQAAKAAQFSNNYILAIYYVEIHVEQLFESLIKTPPMMEFKLDYVLENMDQAVGNELQNILRISYKSIGERDGMFGIGSSYLCSEENRIKFLEEEPDHWNYVMHYYQRNINVGDNMKPLLNCLKQNDFLELAMNNCSINDDVQYECLWRMGNWDYVDNNNSSVKNSNDLNYLKFKAMENLRFGDECKFLTNINEIKNILLEKLNKLVLVASKDFYKIMTDIQSVQELEDFGHALKGNCLSELISNWTNLMFFNEYEYEEIIVTQRNVLLTKVVQNFDDINLKNDITNYIINFAEYARSKGYSMIALRTNNSLLSLPNLSEDLIKKINLKNAQIYLSIKQESIDDYKLIQLCNSQFDPQIKATALKVTRKYIDRTNPKHLQFKLQTNMYEELEALNESHKDSRLNDPKHLVNSYKTLATFMHKEYEEVTRHIKSNDFNAQLNYIQHVRSEKGNYLKGKSKKDVRKSLNNNEKNCKIDETEVEQVYGEKETLLKLAVEYYMLCLSRSDSEDVLIFNLFSLIIENRQNSFVLNLLKSDIFQIPTHKLIQIIPQLLPYIYMPSNEEFSARIQAIIVQCAETHPHHTLPIILSLVYANKDRDYCPSTKKINNHERVQCAKILLTELNKEKSTLAIIKNMEFLFEALIELAYAEIKSKKIPRNLKISKIKDYENVSILTASLPLKKDGNYNDLIGIHCFDGTFSNVGGINAPKRIVCRGTNGREYPQLLKGLDDLRQDAIMQQVFTTLNNLFGSKQVTNQFRIRTYKILPLSMRCGILEWLDDTMTFNEYLSGSDKRNDKGAQRQFRPQDISANQARNEFAKVAHSTHDKKLSSFLKVCDKLRPVFHKFFLTTYTNPFDFFEKRQGYIRSVAVSSMIGKVLGIGDRHLSNILIDKKTAEVIHIDFGIAFELGKVLPTPERVPFRLTRNIIDGFGIAGVEGVFKRSCEKTLEVLRQNDKVILTILEVMLYDPLYDWILGTDEKKKQGRNQDENSDPSTSADSSNEEDKKNRLALRAFLILQDKLKGLEMGIPTSIENQVNTAIKQAIDPENLCEMYCGWQPYL